MKNIHCLIMAGGSGTRFWPRSRTTKPKQYLNLFGNESLLESTLQRFGNFIEPANIYIVSGKDQARVLEMQSRLIPKENLIYEPVGKNTLPCIGLAAMFTEKENPDGILVVSPSDHLIHNDELFRNTVLKAALIADEKDGIVTIGITPSYPATGYGYIQVEKELAEGDEIRQFQVKKFVEKPDREKASSYLKQGGFYWNSGLFVFKVSVFINAIKQFAPDLYSDLRKIQAEIGKPSFDQTLDTVYREVKSISVDYGIMEHAKNIYLVEGNFRWNDLGSWESVYMFSEKDENRNSSVGETIFLNSENSYAYCDEGLVALIGLEDVIVVKEGNAILVCKRNKAEDVKFIVEQLKSSNKNQYL